ncbi:6484_t:CDS:2 [Gigaspora rosea]|nr:6484_t:CDS:2 [Gigaspora rosea]
MTNHILNVSPQRSRQYCTYAGIVYKEGIPISDHIESYLVNNVNYVNNYGTSSWFNHLQCCILDTTFLLSSKYAHPNSSINLPRVPKKFQRTVHVVLKRIPNAPAIAALNGVIVAVHLTFVIQIKGAKKGMAPAAKSQIIKIAANSQMTLNDFISFSGDNDCCSQWGYCGNTPEFCDPNQGCQEGYGTCGLSNTNNVKNNDTNDNVKDVKVIYTCQNPKTVALTFDDGPRSWTNDLLDKLDKANIKATFFMNGHNAEAYCIYDYAEIIQRAYSSGHLIAHHTWSHPYMTGCSSDEVNYQLDSLNIAFKKILGVSPRYFRLPYGDGIDNPSIKSAILAKGMDKIVMWDVDPQDSIAGVTESQCEATFDKETSDLNSHIVLNHDRVENTVNQLAPYEISQLIKNGYKFDTVAGCTGDSDPKNWYNVDTGSFGTKDETWICNSDDMHDSFNTSPQQ